MLSHANYLRYFHGGQETQDTEDLEIETCVEKLLEGNTSYMVSTDMLEATERGTRASLEEAELSLGTHIGGFVPSSNKDFAAKVASLNLGITIPRTAKGNLSVTQTWLSEHETLHPIFQLTNQWRKLVKSLSMIESIREHLVSIDDTPHIRTNWRTYSDNGSGRIISEDYPVAQLPIILQPIIRCYPDRVWANIRIPYLDLKIMAKLCNDSRFCQDLQDPNPLNSIATHLGLPIPGDSQVKLSRFFTMLFYETYDEHNLAAILDEPDLGFLQNKYNDLYMFLDRAILKTMSRKLVDLGMFGRIRDLKLDPTASSMAAIRRKTLSSLCLQNMAFIVKRLIWRLLNFDPSLESEYWIPTNMGVSFTTSRESLQELRSGLTDIFSLEFGAWPVPINATVSISENWQASPEEK